MEPEKQVSEKQQNTKERYFLLFLVFHTVIVWTVGLKMF